MDHQIKTLDNGLRMVAVDTETFPSFTALVLVGAGSRYENKINNGVAHFFEHMVFKGSKKYPTVLELSTLLDSMGSEHNAFTSKDHTGYWIKAPTKHFSICIDILSEMVLHPLLKEEEINREKGVIIEEINMYEDQPQYKVWDLFEGLLYSDNPLGFDTLGRKETVSQFTRETFTEYMSRFYSPKNTVVVIAGGLSSNIKNIKKTQYRVSRPPHPKGAQAIDSKQVFSSSYTSIIENKFGTWKNNKTESYSKYKHEQTKKNILVYTKKYEQAHMVLGYRGLSRNNPNKYTQTILMAILGGGMSSRLFYEVRERRGLCYYIQSGAETFAETGYLFTRAGLTVNIDKINEAIKVIIEEHQKIASGKLSDKEFNKAKDMIKGRFILSLEDSNDLASFFGRQLLLENKLEEPEKRLEKIDRVTREQVVKLAEKMFLPDKFSLALVGPFKSEQIKI